MQLNGTDSQHHLYVIFLSLLLLTAAHELAASLSGPLSGSDVLFHHLVMCFSAQTIRPPDRKSPSGRTTSALPKPLRNPQLHEVVATAQHDATCCVSATFSPFSLLGSSDFGCCSLLWLSNVCQGMPCHYSFEPGLDFANRILLSCGLKSVFIFNYISISIPLECLHYKRCDVCERGLWLVTEGLSLTHPVCPAPLHAWPDLMTHFPLALIMASV